MKKVYVFRYKGEYGDGLAFVSDEKIYKYLCSNNWEFLGTLSEFVKKIRDEVAEKGEVSFWWEG